MKVLLQDPSFDSLATCVVEPHEQASVQPENRFHVVDTTPCRPGFAVAGVCTGSLEAERQFACLAQRCSSAKPVEMRASKSSRRVRMTCLHPSL